jgi:predicted nucleic acid-binding protein
MTLVDTNVLIDVLSDDPVWLDWSIAALVQRSALGPLFVNEVVFAELSVQMESEADLRQTLAELKIVLARAPMPALFLAGKTYERYRAAGGVRTGVLPDFFIGAHAEIARSPILTRDVRRYRTYFPEVELIAPNA